MSEIPNSIRSRIQKLLAFANARGNENETQMAANKVQELLAEYNLELSQFSTSDGKVQVDPDASREKLDGNLQTTADWQSTILRAVAQNNFCLIYRHYDDDDEGELYTLIGRKLNVATTLQVYAYLFNAVERICPITDRRKVKSINSWKEGCADRLSYRLYQQRSESEAASRAQRNEQPRGDGTSLVLSDVYSSEDELNRDFRFGYEPGTSARERKEQEARWAAERERRRNAPVEPQRPATAKELREQEARQKQWDRKDRRAQAIAAAKRDPEAYAMGQNAGSEISLNRQIERDREVRAIR